MTTLEFNSSGKILFVDGKLILDPDCCCDDGDCLDCLDTSSGIEVTASFSNGNCDECSKFDISSLQCPKSGVTDCCGSADGTSFECHCQDDGTDYDPCNTSVTWWIVKDDHTPGHYWAVIWLKIFYDNSGTPQSETYATNIGTTVSACTDGSTFTANKVTNSGDSTQYPSGTFTGTCAPSCLRNNGNCTFPGTISWKFY